MQTFAVAISFAVPIYSGRMLTHPQFDPVAISFGPLSVQWYGLMYLIGLLVGTVLGLIRARRPNSGWTADDIWDLLFYVFVGVILGGRIGYAFFYNPTHFFANPLEIFKVWQGGMSFHGGLFGVIVAVAIFSWRKKRNILAVGDFLAPLCAPGILAGRIGNFINQELWGRPTDGPFGMIFPREGAAAVPRYPSQLAEAFLEGLVLFFIIWIYSSRPRPSGAVAGMFLIWYGLFRIGVEFLREPDAHIGFLAFDWLTMGQVLSLPLVIFGFIMWSYARSQQGNTPGRI